MDNLDPNSFKSETGSQKDDSALRVVKSTEGTHTDTLSTTTKRKKKHRRARIGAETFQNPGTGYYGPLVLDSFAPWQNAAAAGAIYNPGYWGYNACAGYPPGFYNSQIYPAMSVDIRDHRLALDNVVGSSVRDGRQSSNVLLRHNRPPSVADTSGGRSTATGWSESFLCSPDPFDGALRELTVSTPFKEQPVDAESVNIPHAERKIRFIDDLKYIDLHCKRNIVYIKEPRWLGDSAFTKQQTSVTNEDALYKLLESHTGPFKRPSSSVQVTSSLCEKKCRVASARLPLWKLVHSLLVHQKPLASNFDNWFILNSIFDEDDNGTPSAPHHSPDRQIYNHEREHKVLELLLSSDSQLPAMTQATESKDWVNAFFLSIVSGNVDEQRQIMLRYVDSLDQTSPLTSYYKLILGQIPAALKRPDCLCNGKWRNHLLAILALSNSDVPKDLIKQSLHELCAALITCKDYVAYHCCRILYVKQFNTIGYGFYRMILLGLDNTTHTCSDYRHVERVLCEPEVFDSFQLTEIYEFSQDIVLPTLIPFKIAIAKILYDRKLYFKSWRYCEHVSNILLTFWTNEFMFDVESSAIETLIDVCYKLKPSISNLHCSDLSWLPQLKSLYDLSLRLPIDRSNSYAGYEWSLLKHYSQPRCLMEVSTTPTSMFHSTFGKETSFDMCGEDTYHQNEKHATGVYQQIGDSEESSSAIAVGSTDASPLAFSIMQRTEHKNMQSCPIVDSQSPVESPYLAANHQSHLGLYQPVGLQSHHMLPSHTGARETIETGTHIENAGDSATTGISLIIAEEKSTAKVDAESSRGNSESVDVKNRDSTATTELRSQATKPQSSLRPTIFNRMITNIFFKPVNPVNLDEPSNSKFEYDEVKKTWVDKNAVSEDANSVESPPPPQCESPKSLNSPFASQRSYSLAGSKFGYVNAWQQASPSADRSEENAITETTSDPLFQTGPFSDAATTSDQPYSFFAPR